MQVKEQVTRNMMIEAVAVVDIDPALAVYRPIQQKWLSSVELFTEPPKEIRPSSKLLHLSAGLYLLVNYSEKNRLPIYEIDFLAHPTPEWHTIKMPQTFTEKYGSFLLGYRTEELNDGEPLTEVEVLIKNKFNDVKDIFTVPSGFKIIPNNPFSHTYIIVRRMKSILEQTFKAVLLQKYPTDHKRVNLSLLPLFCFPEGIRFSKQIRGYITYNFINTTESGQRIYITCLSFRQSLPKSYMGKLNMRTNEKIFYEKAICIVSRHCYTDQFSQILKHLYRLSMSKNDVPFYKVVQNFVANMLEPLEKGYGLSYSYGGCETNFEINPAFPVVSECAIYCIFKFLPLQAIINTFQAILLEKKVLFVSQSKTVLGFAVEAFLALIYPFKWEHVLIPILPIIEREYLNAPVPLIAGIHPIAVDNTIEPDSLIVQLDTAEVLNDEDLPPLPEKMQKHLRKRLQNFEIYDGDSVKEYLQNPESTYIFKMQQVEHPQFAGNTIRSIFLEFLLTLMKNYRKFWKISKPKQSKEMTSLNFNEPQLLNDIFKVQDFLSDLGMSKVGSFGYKFTEGLLFTAFIQRKHQFPQQPTGLFLDEALEKKKNKKQTQFFDRIGITKFAVIKYPEPQGVKAVFTYQRFPSILNLLKQEDIVLDIVEEPSENEELIVDFIDQEYRANCNFFDKAEEGDELDHKIESLLLRVNRLEFNKIKRKSPGVDRSLNLSILSSSSSSKAKTEQIAFFKEKYLRQKSFLEDCRRKLINCPPAANSFIQISKEEYYKKILDRSLEEPEDSIIAVFQICDKRCMNYHSLLKGSSKILLVDETRSKFNSENLRTSRRRINFEICIPNYEVRFLVNYLIPLQPAEMFSFMLEKLQTGLGQPWTIEHLIEFKERLEKRKQ